MFYDVFSPANTYGMKSLLVYLAIPAILVSCVEKPGKLFTKLPESATGINFRNLLKEDNEQFNVMVNPYFYNGGGVAVGDINNDGLPDILFTGNMVKNRLFLNKGNFKFEDITEKSGIASKEGWCTGATMVDINGDGKLDIYICRSGLANPEYRKNLLFINNGDLTFTEKAHEYGIDDAGYSTQASFFDYDKDGDLDLFVINSSTPEYSRGMLDYSQLRNKPADSLLANHLYRNDGGHFTDVSKQAGIRSNVLTFSLGVNTADINQDGWPDIYVGNDFNEQDYLYINNHDGTFTEKLRDKIDHTCQYSMGVDVADYNNDGLPDILELDMLPENNHDLKMHIGGDNFDKFQYLFNQGYYYQYMKNCLQKNNGDGTFSEIGQLAELEATDWSWSPLLADFDNDGLKDVFISNGYKRDNTNMQFVKYSLDEAMKQKNGGPPITAKEYVSHMSGIKIANYIFRNKGNDQFENKINDWGFNEKTYSNGAVYADLDNDGDLDLVINNIDDYAGIYRNNSESLQKNNYLKVDLRGDKNNSAGIGAKLYAWSGKNLFYQEQLTTRGFQSGITGPVHFGLGNINHLDSLRIIWPDDASQLLKDIRVNRSLIINKGDAHEQYYYNTQVAAPYFSAETGVIDYTHKENYENDFHRQFLLNQFYSHNGPCMTKGDINGDGLEDVFIGGAKGSPGAVFIQSAAGKFIRMPEPALQSDSLSEDVDAVFFDADGDKDLDLYVVSGGYEFDENSPLLQDRLYLNDGKGHFTRALNALPENTGSKSCVRVCDIDGDGDMDIFTGGKVVPGKWPKSSASNIYINDGKGHFTEATEKWAPSLKNIGIVTDAVWADINNDKIKDLVIVGEWMAPQVFLNDHKQLRAADYGLSAQKGWWNTILADDFDGDGDIDLVLGNYGTNSLLRASGREPVELYATDIDGNGSADPIMTSYVDGKSFPFPTMDDINGQVPLLRKKFYDYEVYANATISDIIDPKTLAALKPLQATTFKTVYLENNGKGFVVKDLPVEAQYAPVCAMLSADVNKDGHKDILLFGNNIYNRIRLGRHDANHGTVLLGDGKGSFSWLPPSKHGLLVRGDARSCELVNGQLLVGVNNQAVKTYRLR
jgi:hypothetical protein